MLHHIPELIIRSEDRGKVWLKMSRSEDYLDQLLKGISPDAEEKTTSETNIFSDILDEFADETNTDSEEANEAEVTEEAAETDEFSFDEEELFGDIDVDDEDIFGDDDLLDEDFLREFELEMAKLEGASDAPEVKAEAEPAAAEDATDILSLFDGLDSILSGTSEQVSEAEPEVPVTESETVEEAAVEATVVEEPAIENPVSEEQNAQIEALFGAGDSATETEEPLSMGGFSFGDLFADESSEGSALQEEPQEDADVLKILQGLEGIDLELDEEESTGPSSVGESQNFDALEGLFGTDSAEDVAVEESTEEAKKENKKNKKDKKTGEKTGFMNKLGLILFGEDDEDEEEEKGKNKSKKKVTVEPELNEQGEVTIGVASEADLALFGDYSGASSSTETTEKEPEKGKKGKKKKEKKEKVKKEKVKKEKKPRPKKEKKPKEPDNTPPLPKKPVILIFLMVASFVALVVLGANLLGYSNQLTNAKNLYAKKNYSEAFAEISGMEIKEEDEVLYNKYHVMAMVSVELEAYESLVEAGYYDMAIDCLIRTVGRAEKYRADAETYGCIQELNELEWKAEEILSETFGVSKEEALEFYAYRSKKEYSTAIKNVMNELGLKNVTED